MSSLSPSSRTTLAGPRSPPRPCLKYSLTSGPQSSPQQSQSQSRSRHSQSTNDVSTPPLHSHSHVHFPPSPALSTTFPTHSKKTYDRRPLVVAPNMCALPARGCPGRTYAPGAYRQLESDTVYDDAYADMDVNLDDLLFSSSSSSATVTSATPAPTQLSLPGLVPDHGISSSESDESDMLLSPYGPGPVRYVPFGGDTHMGDRQKDFLPHPPPRDKDRDREREREKEMRRRRRRDRAEEEGRWKTNGLVSQNDSGSCLGGF